VFSRFFIDRPIFAAVLSILITLAGGIAVITLPIAQFPSVSPPVVQVTCNYPGASAQDVADAVAVPIEQQVNGVEGMMYMSSACTNDGTYNLTVTFQHGVNLDMAQVLVQNRVALAIPLLPEVIKQTGVTVKKQSPDIVMGFAITSVDEKRYDQLYLSNYALMQIRDELSRIDGVSEVRLFGQRDYSMRIWLDPGKLALRNISATDVARAVREENNQVATGAIGMPPVPDGQQIQVPLTTVGRLKEIEQFENIIIKAEKGRLVRLKDVCRAKDPIQLDAKNQDIVTRFNKKGTAFLAVFQMPDANALDVRDALVTKMDELKKRFPKGVEYTVAFDTTPYTRESIREVFHTLRDSLILVAAVVLLFLQNWRSALIPLAAVPAAIVGTFAVMAGFGFSLNNLTLFGLVLSIGIVVDDAIVVVEAVEHHIEHGMKPRDATIRAMEQVSGPVIAVGLVLSAVFIPCAFITGITGQFFRQFALTIAVSTIISAFNSLTLSPALCALMLKPRQKGTYAAMPRLAFVLGGAAAAWFFLAPLAEPWLVRGLAYLPSQVSGGLQPAVPWLTRGTCALAGAAAGWLSGRGLNFLLGWFFAKFNTGFMHTTHGYTRLVGLSISGSMSVLLLAFLLAGGWAGWVFLGPIVAPWLTRGLAFLPVAWLHTALPAIAIGVCAVVGAAGGWLAWRVGGVLLSGIFGRRNTGREKGGSFRSRLMGLSLHASVIVLLIYGGMLGLTAWSVKETPKGFIPPQDMGYLMINVQLPDSASMERTQAVMRQIEHIAKEVPGIRHVTTVAGQSFVLNAFGPNFGSSFINLADYADRRDPDRSSEVIANKLRKAFAEQIFDAQVAVFGPPPVRGVSRAGGFMLMVEDRTDAGPMVLQEETEGLVREVQNQPGITGAFSVFRANVPQIKLVADPDASMKRGVDFDATGATLQIYQGSLYVNDFNRFGRTWQVILQAEPYYRDEPEKLGLLKVRNKNGAMVPLGSLGSYRFVNGPLVLTRYNMYPAASINGTAIPGMSSGDVINMVQRLADNTSAMQARRLSVEWTDMSYLELLAGNTAMILFLLAVVMVFLVLAAQYESWSLPLAVILVVPLCLLSAIAGVNAAAMDINIFTQIGFVVLVGLASKNAILIVEFAKKEREAGVDRQHATQEACRLRLRPILMTSLAFVLGVLPLITSKGAGAEMRRTLGTAVFSGMIGVTLFGIFLTPVFFYVIDYLSGTPAFSSPRVRRIGGMMRDGLTLRFVWELAREGWRKAAEAVRHRRPSAVPAGRMAAVHSTSVNGAMNGAPAEGVSVGPVEQKRG
jgi:multidrug efflux pump subunit AcrB